jgi:hypothetical protein
MANKIDQVTLKVYDSNSNYWVDCFCNGGWRIKDPTTGAWLLMTPQNTRIRDEYNAKWYQIYCPDTTPTTEPPPPPPPLTTSLSIPATTPQATTGAAITTTPAAQRYQSISFSSYARNLTGGIANAMVDMTYLDNSIQVGNADIGGQFYFFVMGGAVNLTGVDIRGTLNVVVELSSDPSRSFHFDLSYGGNNQFLFLPQHKTTWCGQAIITIPPLDPSAYVAHVVTAKVSVSYDGGITPSTPLALQSALFLTRKGTV